MKFASLVFVLTLFVGRLAFSDPSSTSDQPPGSPAPLKPSVAMPAAQQGPAPLLSGSGSAVGEKDKVAKIPTQKDDRQTQELLNKLAKEAGWFPDVEVTVNNGIVVIKGSAKNAEQLNWLAKTADRLPGVVAVINRAIIETPPISDLAPAKAELRSLIESGKKASPLLVLALLMMAFFIVAGIYFMRLLRVIWGRHIANPFLLATVTRLTMIPIWAILFYLTLKTAGLSDLATTLIGGTGAVGLVLGLAFRGIAENYLAGILLAIRSPFTKGDEIKLDKYGGFVQSLNMRGTTIIDYDGNVVLIPNSIVIQSVISNRTTNSMTRTLFSVSISFADPLSKALELITQILADVKDIGAKPGASVSVDKLSASGIDLLVIFWFDAVHANGDKIKATLIERIKDELVANGFHIPDPAREILFADPLKIRFLKSRVEADNFHSDRAEAARTKASEQLADRPAGKSAGDSEASQPAGPQKDLKAIAEDATILKKSVHSDLLQE